MHDSLRNKIVGVRRQARWTLILHGVGWGLVVGIGALLITGLLDFYLQLDDRLSRITLSLSFLLAILLIAFRFFLAPLRRQFTDVDVAQRIQDRFPKLHNKVASAIEFSNQKEEDLLAGSAALREAVIEEATEDLEQVPLGEVVRYRPAVTAAGGALAGLIAVLLIAFCLPTGSGIALARLTNPFGNTVWPQINQLVFRNPPTHIPSGGLFEVEVVDQKNNLPENVVIEYRFAANLGMQLLQEPMRSVDGILVAQRKNVRQSFSFRAVGGDDETPWHPLEVVESARADAPQVELQPPAYTQWPASKGSGYIVGLVGSTIQLTAHVNKPLESAMLQTETGVSKPLNIEGLQISLANASAAPWVLKESGDYSFTLIDQFGIEGGQQDHWQVRGLTDEPPFVSIETPSPQIQSSPDATVPVRVLTKDGLTIRDVSLHYTRGDAVATGAQVIALFRGPNRAPQLSAEGLEAHLARGDRRIDQYEWELAPLNLPPGTEITYWASAHDYQPAEGKSAPLHRITIVTKQELAEQLAIHQRALLAELSRVVGREKDSHSNTRGLEIQLGEVGHLDEKALHQLRGIELTEREVRQALVGNNDSILQKADALLAELKNNNIRRPEMARQLGMLAAVLQGVETDHLGSLEQELTKARKFLQADLPRGEQTNSKNSGEPQPETHDPAEAPHQTKRTTRQQSRTGDALEKAGGHQEQVIAALEHSLKALRQWDQYRRMIRDLASLENKQRKIRDQTRATGDATLGRDLRNLEPQQRADLKKIAERQRELARNVDRMLEEMQQTEQILGQTDPIVAASIANSIRHAHEMAIGNEMRSASQNVDHNQIGQALSRQQEAGKQLAEMSDILKNRGEPELARLVEKLREAESQLSELTQNHERLKKKLQQAAKQNDTNLRKQALNRLAPKREQLHSQMGSMANALQRLRAQEASQSVSNAAERVAQSGQSAQAGDTGSAQQQAEQAQSKLEQAREQLAKTRQQAEAERLDEQMAQLPDHIRSLIDRQRALQRETAGLDQLRDNQQRLNRSQKGQAIELAQQQLQLRDNTSAIAGELTAAEIFQRTMENVAEKMQQAFEDLGAFRTSERTQRMQQEAIGTLTLMKRALAREKQSAPKKNQGGGAGGGQGGGNQPQGKQRSLTELKLLKLLQEDLNQRVAGNQAEIDEREARGHDIRGLLEERIHLAEEQGRLADATFDLLRSEQQDITEESQKQPAENRSRQE